MTAQKRLPHSSPSSGSSPNQFSVLQVFVLQPIVAGSPISIESNAGKATDRGGEIELKLLLAQDWLISGTVGDVHAVFTKFDTETSAGVPLSLAGNRFPRQPQWTASALLQYRWPLVNGASVLLHSDWNYRGDYYVNADLHNPYIPGRTVGNLRAGLRILRSSISVSHSSATSASA